MKVNPRHQQLDRLRTLMRGIGQTLITLGVVILLFCVYEVKVTSAYTAGQQEELGNEIARLWAATATGPQGPVLPVSAQGSGFARIYFPTLGRDARHVVVEGVSTEDLKKGPGHFPGTDQPGDIGNMVLSGHRTTYGAPFNRIDELNVGDPIVVEDRGSFHTYRVEKSFIVKPTAIGVTYRVPDRPQAVPTRRLLTLTTCHPKFSAKQRLVVRAVLDSSLNKGPGVVPPALQDVA